MSLLFHHTHPFRFLTTFVPFAPFKSCVLKHCKTCIGFLQEAQRISGFTFYFSWSLYLSRHTLLVTSVWHKALCCFDYRTFLIKKLKTKKRKIEIWAVKYKTFNQSCQRNQEKLEKIKKKKKKIFRIQKLQVDRENLSQQVELGFFLKGHLKKTTLFKCPRKLVLCPNILR